MLTNKKYENLYYYAAISTIIDKCFELKLSSGNTMRFTLEDSSYIDPKDITEEPKPAIGIRCTIMNEQNEKMFSITFTKVGRSYCFRPMLGLYELERCQIREKTAYIFSKESFNSRFIIEPIVEGFDGKYVNAKGHISQDELDEINDLAYYKIFDLEEKIERIEQQRPEHEISRNPEMRMVFRNKKTKFIRA